jgi:hypothetical protein
VQCAREGSSDDPLGNTGVIGGAAKISLHANPPGAIAVAAHLRAVVLAGEPEKVGAIGGGSDGAPMGPCGANGAAVDSAA